MDKIILLASFIFPERVEWFIEYLGENFNISRNRIFCYENLDDESKVIVTFKLVVPEDKRLDLKNLFPNATIIHKKGNALYTINALNKLVLQDSKGEIGNINLKTFQIDWEKYQNKLILIDNNQLVLRNIKRIF